MTSSLNATILQNLLVQRELAIAKIQFTTLRLERLEAQIADQKWVVENEKQQSEKVNA